MGNTNSSKQRLAIYFDMDNCGKYITEIFEHCNSFGKLKSSAIYGVNISNKMIAKLKRADIRYTLVDCNHVKGIKNTTDIQIIVDVMDRLTDKKIDTHVIVSSDTDFRALYQYTQRHNKNLIIIGNYNLKKKMTDYCDEYVTLESIINEKYGCNDVDTNNIDTTNKARFPSPITRKKKKSKKQKHNGKLVLNSELKKEYRNFIKNFIDGKGPVSVNDVSLMFVNKYGFPIRKVVKIKGLVQFIEKHCKDITVNKKTSEVFIEFDSTNLIINKSVLVNEHSTSTDSGDYSVNQTTKVIDIIDDMSYSTDSTPTTPSTPEAMY